MVGNNRLQEAGGSVNLRPEPRAVCCTSLMGICSGAFPPSSLAEHSLCLIPVFPAPFSSVLTLPVGTAWEVQLRRNPGALTRGSYRWDRSLPEWWLYDLRGKLAEEQRLLQELHVALDRALRRPLVLVEHWGAGASSSSMGEGSSSPSKSCRISFLSLVNFCVINIVPFPFLI